MTIFLVIAVRNDDIVISNMTKSWHVSKLSCVEIQSKKEQGKTKSDIYANLYY